MIHSFMYIFKKKNPVSQSINIKNEICPFPRNESILIVYKDCLLHSSYIHKNQKFLFFISNVFYYYRFNFVSYQIKNRQKICFTGLKRSVINVITSSGTCPTVIMTE